MYGTINYAQLQRPSAMKTPKIKGESDKLVSCHLPPNEKSAVDVRVEIEGTDKSKWLRRLIRRELARKPKT